MRKIKELEERVKELENSQLRNGFTSLIKQKMLESELHNEIANRLEDRCNGDKSTLTAYMNFIYRLKTLRDDIELFDLYLHAPKEIGILTDEGALEIRSEISGVCLYDESPKLIINRLNKYNDHLYFDELNEKSFEFGYWVDVEGDYVWKQDDKSYEEKYAELIKCICNLLLSIQAKIAFQFTEIRDRFPKLAQLIERNIDVCQDKLNELENKRIEI